MNATKQDVAAILAAARARLAEAAQKKAAKEETDRKSVV